VRVAELAASRGARVRRQRMRRSSARALVRDAGEG